MIAGSAFARPTPGVMATGVHVKFCHFGNDDR